MTTHEGPLQRTVFGHDPVTLGPEDCIRHHSGGCSGTVEWRLNPDTFKGAGPFCGAHWREWLAERTDIIEKYNPYGSCPPEGFDPTYAGERWDDDY